MKRKKLKKKIINIFLIVLVVISLIVFSISAYNIIKWKYDSNKINDETKSIQKKAIINISKDNSNTEIIPSNENKSNPYWDYIKMNLIDVNFTNLKAVNSQTKGWIKVNGTNINYPFVQTTNNSYYLTHSYNKNYNQAGWVFLDYRNNLENNQDKNTIIYAHGRLDNTMFGSLKNILKSGWLDNYNNHIIKLSTEYENTLWQVFSVYKTPTTSDYLQINFNNDFKNFVNMLKNRSAYQFNTIVNETDRILTLSTCYNNDEKVVLHAKLIKKETR